MPRFRLLSGLRSCVAVVAAIVSVGQQARPVGAGRFALEGPVLTVTLREPSFGTADSASKWINFDALHPTALWTVTSTQRPLPSWLPSLKAFKASLAYRYDDLRRMPSFVETEAVVGTSVCDFNLQPSYEFRAKRTNLLLQASRGASYAVARFTTHGRRWVEFVRGSHTASLPSASPIGGVRITAAYDFLQDEPTCKLEATTMTQRTRAVLNLEKNDPSVSVFYALDERHTIAPEISLRDAKITYQWNWTLQSGSIRTKVDPTTAVYVTWTDRSQQGTWVTDLRLPLEGTTVSALAADMRIRRQFVF